MNWSQIFNDILPLIGVIIGSCATYVTQNQIFKRQRNRDIEKENESKNIECLSVYSEILKINGENMMQDYSSDISGFQFNVSTYKKKFRPIFCSKFYLLERDIVNSIRKMDELIYEEEFIGTGIPGDYPNNSLIKSFEHIIMSVENTLDEYRKK